MNGQMTKYDKYLDSLQSMAEPTIPDVKFDMRGLVEYARQKGMLISQLTDEEKKLFVTSK